jgi:hypothetical protein
MYTNVRKNCFCMHIYVCVRACIHGGKSHAWLNCMFYACGVQHLMLHLMLRVDTRMSVGVYVYTCLYVCMYIRMYVYTRVWTHVYRVENLMQHSSGVEYYGMVDHVTLSHAYASAGFWLYPIRWRFAVHLGCAHMIICIYIYIYMHTHTHAYTHTYIHIHTYNEFCVHTYFVHICASNYWVLAIHYCTIVSAWLRRVFNSKGHLVKRQN